MFTFQQKKILQAIFFSLLVSLSFYSLALLTREAQKRLDRSEYTPLLIFLFFIVMPIGFVLLGYIRNNNKKRKIKPINPYKEGLFKKNVLSLRCAPGPIGIKYLLFLANMEKEPPPLPPAEE